MFPASAGAVGNSDQPAPMCEIGQFSALLDGTQDPGKHIGKFIDCISNLAPSSKP
jgi:hypothetical protein